MNLDEMALPVDTLLLIPVHATPPVRPLQKPRFDTWTHDMSSRPPTARMYGRPKPRSAGRPPPRRAHPAAGAGPAAGPVPTCDHEHRLRSGAAEGDGSAPRHQGSESPGGAVHQ